MLEKARKDWDKATKRERGRFIIIMGAIVLVGCFGIYEAMKHYITREPDALIAALLAVIILLVLKEIPWRDRSKHESNDSTGNPA